MTPQLVPIEIAADEFEFRYNNRVANGVDDAERSNIALRLVAGKRITYRGADF